jgi:hypothetical protein
MIDTIKTTETNGAGVPPSSKRPVASFQTNPNFQRILKSKRFLNTDDKDLYRQNLQALVEDAKPQSFLEWQNVEDYADKLQDERRYKDAIPRLIDGRMEPSKRPTMEPEKREADVVERYLPGLIKLTRLVDNSFDIRKRIEKDFRRTARSRPKDAAPPIAPDDNTEA